MSGDNFSSSQAISADGRYVAFYSYASNLVAGDTNNVGDVFVRDLVTETTMLISATSSGVIGNSVSTSPVISADGRYLAFMSSASNLTAGDTNGARDIFVRDLIAGTTRLVGATSGAGSGNGSSSLPVISANGRYVAFLSNANDLVAGDANGTQDVFVRDLVTETTHLVSATDSGASGDSSSSSPAISAAGRYVAFLSSASNLVANDANGKQDVLVRDLVAGTTTLVSTTSSGGSGDSSSSSPVISADGRFVAFLSSASNLVANDANATQDAFVRDLVAGTTTLVSAASSGASGNCESYSPVLSADGRHIAFESYASDLVANDANGAIRDVFVRDLSTGVTTLMSAAAGGGSRDSTNPVFVSRRWSIGRLPQLCEQHGRPGPQRRGGPFRGIPGHHRAGGRQQ